MAMSHITQQVEFFARISYNGREPQIVIVPTGMPGHQGSMPETGNSAAEGHLTLAESIVETSGAQRPQIRLSSITDHDATDAIDSLGDSVGILSAYKYLQTTHGAIFEDFLLAATSAARQCRWSEFPMSFPDAKQVSA